MLPDYEPVYADEGQGSGQVLDLYPGVRIIVTLSPGQVRTGDGPQGPWAMVMPCYYGELEGSIAQDQERMDALVGVGASPHAYSIMNLKMQPDGTSVPDEEKLILGAFTPRQALEIWYSVYGQAVDSGALDHPRCPDPDSYDMSNAARYLGTYEDLAVWLQGGGLCPVPTATPQSDAILELTASLAGLPLMKAKVVPIGTETTRRDGGRWRKVEAGKWQQIRDGKIEKIPDMDQGGPSQNTSQATESHPANWMKSFGLDGNTPPPDIHPATVKVDSYGDIDAKPVLKWTDLTGRQQRSYTVAFHNRRYRSLREKVAGYHPAIAKAWSGLKQPKTDAEAVTRLALMSGMPPATLMSIKTATVSLKDESLHFVIQHADGHTFPMSTQDPSVVAYWKSKQGGGGEVAFDASPKEVTKTWRKLGLPDATVVRAHAVSMMAADAISKLPKPDFSKSKTDGVTQTMAVLAEADKLIAANLGNPPPAPGMTYVPPAIVAAMVEAAGGQKWWPGAFAQPTKGMKIAMGRGAKAGASDVAKSFIERARAGVTREVADEALEFFSSHPGLTPTDPAWADALCYGGRTAPDFYLSLQEPTPWIETLYPTTSSPSPTVVETSSTATSSTNSPPAPRPTSTPATSSPASPTAGPSLQSSVLPSAPAARPTPPVPEEPPARSPSEAETLPVPPVAPPREDPQAGLPQSLSPRLFNQGDHVVVLRRGMMDKIAVAAVSDDGEQVTVVSVDGSLATLPAAELQSRRFDAATVARLVKEAYLGAKVSLETYRRVAHAAIEDSWDKLYKAAQDALQEIQANEAKAKQALAPAPTPPPAVVTPVATPLKPAPVPKNPYAWVEDIVTQRSKEVTGYLRSLGVRNRFEALRELTVDAPVSATLALSMLSRVGGPDAVEAAIAAALRRS